MTAFVDRLQRLPHSPRVARAAALVAAAFAIAALARLCLVLVADPILPVTPAPRASQSANHTPIADWHLFGLADDAPRATALAGLIHGTLARADPAQGLVFLAASDGQDRVVHVGESLPGGGTLTAVYADHVQVRHGEREETVALVATTRMASTTVATVADAKGMPDGLFAEGNFVPMSERGRVVGLRVALTDVAELERLGLRRGDIITAINGVPVAVATADPARLVALAAQLGGAARPTLSLRRGGRALELTPGI